MTLELNDVTLTYPDGDTRLTALADVSLTVERNEFLPLVGPSGSGKSSLLAVAATLITPDTGTVTIDGTSTTGLTRAELARMRREQIGIVFQQPNLLPSLTAYEQLEVMGHIGGRTRVSRAGVMGLLESVGMADLAGRRPGQLSGGQRQRVNIARALVNSPAVLLVDEPTSALDHERSVAVMNLLRRITTERHTATVVVTHDVVLINDDERVVECHDGRLVLPVAVAA